MKSVRVSNGESWLKAILVLWLLAPSFAGAVIFTNLHSFLVAPLGSRPLAPLLPGTDGNLYGTASAGGLNGGQGTVFKSTTNGLVTLLHAFTGAEDGGDVQSALIQGRDGSLYGTTAGGGVYSNGTVFRITTNAVLTNPVQFTGGDDGSTPVGGLVLGQDGNLYGMTESGGAYGYGTVFRLGTNGQLTTLFAFDLTNGAYPLAPLVSRPDGRLYATTTQGGAYDAGIVFQITTNGDLTTLVSLGASQSDAMYPEAPLVQGAGGNCYGTAYNGGAKGLGCVFQVTTSGAYTNLYSFGAVTNSNGNPLDGSHPVGALLFGSDGNLYGTTESGGTNDLSSGGDGTIFTITPAGVLTTLYSFSNGVDGAGPDAALVLVGGNFYGTASKGGVAPGALGNGTIFKLGTNGVFTSVYDFPGADGFNPSAELTMDEVGNIYGTAEYGGRYGQGIVFKYQLNGTYSILAEFNVTNGAVPDGQLLRLADGSYLGTTLHGGTNSRGTVFKVTTNGVLTTVYHFGSVTNGPIPLDGEQPWSGLTLAPDGNFYGTTRMGGAQGSGVVFGLTPSGTLVNAVPLDSSAKFPAGANLVMGPGGKLYGTTSLTKGSIFSYVPGAGSVSTLYAFPGVTNGFSPRAGLALGSDNALYGTTTSGGDYGYGTIFRITSGGQFTKLYSFDGTNGGEPQATLVLGNDGNFYGTTVVGGSANNGVIFQFQPDGTYVNLHSFMGVPDGANPDCGLTMGPDGNLYGTAEFGGASGNGTLFELLFADPPPVILSVHPTNNAVVLSWSAVTGRIYQLQFSGDLTRNGWSNLGLPVAAASSVVVKIDPSALPARRYYRVVMLP